MRCKKCGTDVGSNAKFCFNCGAPICNQSLNSNSYTFDMYIQDLCAVTSTFPLLLCNGFMQLNSDLSSFLDESEKDDSIDKVIDFLSAYDTYSLEKDFDFFNLKEFGEMIINYINNSIQVMINESEIDEDFLNDFILDVEGSSSNLTNTITQVLRQDLGMLYSRIQSSIPKLVSYNKIYKENFGMGETIGSIAKSFAKNFTGGALAVANPIVGIPMLISNFFGDKKEANKDQQIIDNIQKEWSNFCETMDHIIEKRLQSIGRVQSFIKNKVYESLKRLHTSIIKYSRDNNINIDIPSIYLFNEVILEEIKDMKSDDDGFFEFFTENLREQGISKHFDIELNRV